MRAVHGADLTSQGVALLKIAPVNFFMVDILC
jgi:hypothetical protein